MRESLDFTKSFVVEHNTPMFVRKYHGSIKPNLPYRLNIKELNSSKNSIRFDQPRQ